MSVHTWEYGSGTINGIDISSGKAVYSTAAEFVDIEDTSTMPMTVLERRPTKSVGVLTLTTGDTSQKTLLASALSQQVVSVEFAGIDGGNISMQATVIAASIAYTNGEYAVFSATFKSLGASAPTVS